MSHGIGIGAPEAATQRHVIELFTARLGYEYLGDKSEGHNDNVDAELLARNLARRGYSAHLANKATEKLREAAANIVGGDLYAANKAVYSMLKCGVNVQDEHGTYKDVQLIDYEDLSQNDYSIAEEVTVSSSNYTKRPDLVIYVNGIALGVIELKKSSVSVMTGICQNINNQGQLFIRRFFTTMQLVCAANTSEGLRYGTVETDATHYLQWKDDGYARCLDEQDPADAAIDKAASLCEEKLDRQLIQLFSKRRLLTIIRDFTIFDKGIKKLCRYNQYYAAKRAMRRLAQRKGGIIWHTQGSGKSLTMVWLSKLILEADPNARVLIVTDRDELDDQIEKLYKGVDLGIVRARKCSGLIDMLDRVDGGRLMCSLIHKFGHHGKTDAEASEADVKKYIDELKTALPEGFRAKGNITVFVDECHRTQSGLLHEAMKAIMPDAVLVGFTGTPLFKKDKRTSLETFGDFIHTYTFPEAVRDGVVLDIRYEARDIPQEITAQEQIDAWFEAKTKGLNDRAKAKLKKMWATMQNVVSSEARLKKVVEDIILDFGTKPRLMDGAGNAMLAADSISTACKYYELFVAHGFTGVAVISSYVPSPGDVATDAVSVTADTDAQKKFNTYLGMIGINPKDDAANVARKVEDFEREARRKFVEEPATMKLLIVIDKLLTGFDAPKCTYLYIDKHMQDHGLFQAICRVNRLDDASKDFGYIVDYQKLFGDLREALDLYSTDVFKKYDAEDVQGLVKNVVEEAKSYFAKVLETLDALCEGVEPPAQGPQYRKYFCGDGELTPERDVDCMRLRGTLYSLVGALVRAFAQLKPRFAAAGIDETTAAEYEKRVTFYLELRKDIGLASGDFLDLKAYEPDMRYLIDTYINAGDSKKLTVLDDFTLLDFIGEKQQENNSSGDGLSKKEMDGIAETIENNTTKELVKKHALNPAFYRKMSQILKKLIEERKAGVLAYRELLEKYRELAEAIKDPGKVAKYPPSMANEPLIQALYDNFGQDEQLATSLHNAILGSKMPDFQFNVAKQNQIKRALYQILQDEGKVEAAYAILAAQEGA